MKMAEAYPGKFGLCGVELSLFLGQGGQELLRVKLRLSQLVSGGTQVVLGRHQFIHQLSHLHAN
jgi:hypothetical protein